LGKVIDSPDAVFRMRSIAKTDDEPTGLKLTGYDRQNGVDPWEALIIWQSPPALVHPWKSIEVENAT
jgi:hypothetical protein